MDPYVLALQLYLFNKACGGMPLRIAEQVVITGVLNTTCWTARTIGSGVMWLVKPSTTSRSQSNNTNNTNDTNNTNSSELYKVNTMSDSCDHVPINTDLDTQFEIITPEQITELEKEMNTANSKR